MATSKKMLLLGAGGFIGCHMTRRLVADGVHEVVCVDITPEKIQDVLQQNNPNVKFLNIDIRKEPHLVEEQVMAADIVVDLIAFANPSLYVTNPLDVFDLNFTENLKIVEYCVKHKKRLVQFSTCEVYGVTAAQCVGKAPMEMPCVFNEDTTPLIMGPINEHRWIYASAKQLLERVLHAYGIEHDFNYTIIRPFNFVGPQIDYLPSEQDGNPRVFSHFIDALLYGKPMKLVDGGHNLRGYTLIDDAVECIMRILENPNGVCDKQIFNIGAPENEFSIREMAFMLRDMFNKEFRLPSDPANIEIIDVSAEEFYGKGYADCPRRIADITKAKELLGWEPKFKLEEVMRRTMASFVAEHRKKQAAAMAAADTKAPPAKRVCIGNGDVGVAAVRV